jgi:hypothetical protein
MRAGTVCPQQRDTLAETRVLVLIDKVSQTPDAYPRGRGLPRKHPIGCAEAPCAGDEQAEV